MPVHVEDLRWWTEEILGRTVAVQTPLHAEGLGLIDHAHLIDGAMAAIAAHTTVHMDGVVEVGVVGQTVNLHPGNRLAGLPAFTHGSEARAIGKDLALSMTVNTGLRGRKIRVGGHFDEAMAVAAIHPKLLDMQGVGEGHGLVRLIADTRVFRREVIPDSKCDRGTNNQHTD